MVVLNEKWTWLTGLPHQLASLIHSSLSTTIVLHLPYFTNTVQIWILKVIKVEVQKTLPGSSVYRSVRFDIFAVDSKGVKYDIEIQNDIADATPDRARFYLAMIDSHTVKKGIKK